MKNITEMVNKPKRTEKIIQFGEGGFLRGFIDWMIQKIDDTTDFNGSVVVVQPIEMGMCDVLTSQNCLYTHIIRGKEGIDKTLVDVISRCVKPYDDFDSYLKLAENPDFRFIFSNTTEAGIVFHDTDKPTDVPPASYPAKLTLLLKRRFDLGLGGFILVPCELIEKNGENLKKAILQYADLWNLGDGFTNWIQEKNVFCNTLVDRINTGYPKDENIDLGYEDKMVNTSEYFHLFVIETDCDIQSELPFDKAGLNVIVTPDKLSLYRTRKVRILNGAHTSLVPYALLSGFDTVKSCMNDKTMLAHIRKCVYDEIIPTLDLPHNELVAYADNVLTRFDNPYIKHYLSAISLNSVSKFCVRVLPSIKEYKKRFGTYPPELMFSFKKLIEFYQVGTPSDAPEVIAAIRGHELPKILANKELWGEDLSGLYEDVKNADTSIR